MSHTRNRVKKLSSSTRHVAQLLLDWLEFNPDHGMCPGVLALLDEEAITERQHKEFLGLIDRACTYLYKGVRRRCLFIYRNELLLKQLGLSEWSGGYEVRKAWLTRIIQENKVTLVC